MKIRKGLDQPFLDPDRQLVSLKIVIASALTISFIISWKLWISSRLFPLSPIADFLPTLPSPIDYLWFLTLFALLLAILIKTRSRKLILTFVVSAVLLSLFDQTRWQPWFYQFIFMLLALGLFAWKEPEIKNNSLALNACRLIIACTYFWSGVQKLNVTFIKETWPDAASYLLQFLPQMAPWFFFIIPLLEIAIGIGLLIPAVRNAAVILATVTHVFILIMLVLSGENTVVWPWNVAMILFAWILFWRDSKTGTGQIVTLKHRFQAVVLLLFGVLPAFSLVGLWDSYLSLALFSGNTQQAVIYLDNPVIDQIPAAIRPHIWQENEPYFLDINRWSYGELNVPVYPEPRIYRAVARQICKYGRNLSDIKLIIREKPGTISGVREPHIYECNQVH
jgi:hypothetical protein